MAFAGVRSTTNKKWDRTYGMYLTEYFNSDWVNTKAEIGFREIKWSKSDNFENSHFQVITSWRRFIQITN